MKPGFRLIVLLLASLAPLPVVRADVRLPALISDRMVLQQNSSVRLWGWSYEGETVDIETSWGETARTTGNARGEWSVRVKTPAARQLDAGVRPEHITFTSRQNTVQIRDVLIGEVWLCSGQSNMVLMLGPDYPAGANQWYGEKFWAEEQSRTDRPGLRIFNVEKRACLTPADDCRGVLPDHVRLPKNEEGLLPAVRHGWQSCSPETAPFISALAYYFGATLQEELGVPVGVVISAVGGSSIEAWMSREAIADVPGLAGTESKVGLRGPIGLYNGMIAPLAPMTWRGVIWYQGEGNTRTGASRYAGLLEKFIHDWRRTFEDPELPFGIVQLASYGKVLAEPSDSNVALVREAQADVAARVPGVGLAVTIDLGAETIHPPNKRDVGRRLALIAFAKAYGRSVVCSGPTFDHFVSQGSSLRVYFKNIAGGLVAKDGPLRRFAIAGADGKYVWAEATIEGDSVVVSSPQVAQPVAVRYAWANNAEGCNLYNQAGLPASPFRTDRLGPASHPASP